MSISYICQLLTIWFFVELSLTLGLSAQAQSQFKPTNTTSIEQSRSQASFRPPKQGKPRETYGAGSRSRLICSTEEQPIRPSTLKQNYKFTFQERPTPFVEIPKTSAPEVVFMFRRASLLMNAEAEKVYFTQQNPKQPLEMSNKDQWFSLIVCGQIVQLDDSMFPI
ncbi:hypothetical protein [Brasilonema sp. UFV-L1]|uniref:hypothetical protein n=1 Tax=Brasilonema sp. UFV-L1 TaxID=2234130 RepID=UPI00145E8AC3|nr:hypothetical protein [Brasilonema sp. UFV-L1]NMG07247.1 hypothetical protein [Brasilonema sp. UFV-L1]